MSFYEDNVKERKEYEEELLESSYASLEGSLTGEFRSNGKADYSIKLGMTIDLLLDELHIHKVWQPRKNLEFRQQMEYLVKTYGIMYSFVDSKTDWYKNDLGPLIGELKSGDFVLLTKKKYYSYSDPESKKTVVVNEAVLDNFKDNLVRFYVPFPDEKLNDRSLALLAIREMRLKELVRILVFSLAAIICGTALPVITNFLMTHADVTSWAESVSSDGTAGYWAVILGSCMMLFLPFIVFRYVFSAFKDNVLLKMANRISEKFQVSLMMRIYSIQPEEMSGYSAGDLGNHVIQTGVMARRLVVDLVTIIIDLVLVISYIIALGFNSGHFVKSISVYFLIAFLINVFSAYKTSKVSYENMQYGVEAQSMTHNIIEGIEKIFLAGAKARGFARWTDTYKKGIRSKYRPPVLTVIITPVTIAIFALCLIECLEEAFVVGIPYNKFYVFFMIYGLIIGVLTDMFAHMQTVAMDAPHLKMIVPILSAKRETNTTRVMVDNLKGNVSMRKVCYQYPGDDRIILNNISFDIAKGESVAIVGKTGCGKSTVLRLLLGFAQPVQGTVLYDGQPLESLDLKSVGSRLGVVLQDSTVVRGTIEDNIRLNAPDISEDEVWEAVRFAGLESEILRLPLQLKTPLPYGGKGMSGGQIQKVLIARAIASKPNILIFDEATSALDNISQKYVTEALENLKCTRIIVAHRLSTIQNCDRILVLDKGRVAEEGDYGSLMKKEGLFAELVKRQNVYC